MKYTAKPRLSFREALKSAFSDLGGFERKRVRRSEYWWCMLAGALYVGAFALIRYILEDLFHLNLSYLLIDLIFVAVSIVPIGLWVMENYGRLHDTGRRDSWLAGIFLPLAAAVVVYMAAWPSPLARWAVWGLLAVAAVFSVVCIVFCLQDSDKGENDYGPSPKYTPEEE